MFMGVVARRHDKVVPQLPQSYSESFDYLYVINMLCGFHRPTLQDIFELVSFVSLFSHYFKWKNIIIYLRCSILQNYFRKKP